MQEQVIKDLIGLARKSAKELSLNFIASAQENIELVKNPLNMIDVSNHDSARYSRYTATGQQRGEEPLLPTGSQKHGAGTRADYMSDLDVSAFISGPSVSGLNAQELVATLRTDEEPSTGQKIDDLMRNIKDVPFE